MGTHAFFFFGVICESLSLVLDSGKLKVPEGHYVVIMAIANRVHNPPIDFL